MSKTLHGYIVNNEHTPACRPQVMGSRRPMPANQNLISVVNGEDLKNHGAFQSQTLASGLQKCLATAWQADDPFSDFDVIVDGFTYRCHKHLLNATSGYFQSVFRSGMKESIENRLELKLMSRDIFEVIGRALYTGVSGLTKDNIQDIWPATQLLQIKHLSDECEHFALQHVDNGNCVEMYYFAKSIFSPNVANRANNFMIFGFEAMIKTEAFLQLMTPDVFADLLENRHLNVSSEDVAVNSILKWAQYQPELTHNEDNTVELELTDCLKDTPVIEIGCFIQTSDEDQRFSSNEPKLAPSPRVHNHPVANERLKHLPKLLRSAKMLLVSGECLKGLIGQSIARESPECLEIINEAVEFFGKSDPNHWAWLKSGTHRFSSRLEHAVIIMTADQLTVYRMEPPHTVSHVAWIPHTPGVTYKDMIVFKNKIFMEGVSTFNSSLVVILDEERNWNHAMFDDASYDSNPNYSSRLFSHNGSLYRFNVGVLHRFCEFPDDSIQTPWAEVFRSEDIRAATEIVSFESFILFFINTEQNAIVYGLDTETGVFRQMHDFDGRAWCLNTIRHGNITYILQPCGALKRLVNMEDGVRFEPVAQLWDCEWFPMLAVTYLKKLVVFGKDFGVPLDETTVVKVLPGLFDCIEIVKLDQGYQCFPMIVPRRWFN